MTPTITWRALVGLSKCRNAISSSYLSIGACTLLTSKHEISVRDTCFSPRSSMLQPGHHRETLSALSLHLDRGFATRGHKKPPMAPQKSNTGAQTPQQQQKQEEKQQHRINNGITFPMLRVVFPNRSALVMNRSAALAAAKALALDLVMVNDTADPPIAKILNYQDLLKQQADVAAAAAEKEKESLRLSAGKELKIGHKIADNDLGTKVRKARDILKDGYRCVSCCTRGWYLHNLKCTSQNI